VEVLRALGQSLFLFSSLLSVYHGVTCLSSHVRHEDDSLNAVLGGAAAGVVVSIPSRNPRLIAQNAVGMAVVGVVMDYIAKPPVQSQAGAIHRPRKAAHHRMASINSWHSGRQHLSFDKLS
jgi:hypothetical protein